MKKVLLLLFGIFSCSSILGQIIEERSEDEIEEVILEDDERQKRIDRYNSEIKENLKKSTEGLSGRIEAAVDKQIRENAEAALRENKIKERDLKPLKEQREKMEKDLNKKASQKTRDRYEAEKQKMAEELQRQIKAMKHEAGEKTYNAVKKENAKRNIKNEAILNQRKDVANSSGGLHVEMKEQNRPKGFDQAPPADFGAHGSISKKDVSTLSLSDMLSSVECDNKDSFQENEILAKEAMNELELLKTLDTLLQEGESDESQNKEKTDSETKILEKKRKLEEILKMKPEEY